MTDKILNELLRKDPLAQAEEITGLDSSNHKTAMLGLGLHIEHNRKKN